MENTVVEKFPLNIKNFKTYEVLVYTTLGLLMANILTDLVKSIFYFKLKLDISNVRDNIGVFSLVFFAVLIIIYTAKM